MVPNTRLPKRWKTVAKTNAPNLLTEKRPVLITAPTNLFRAGGPSVPNLVKDRLVTTGVKRKSTVASRWRRNTIATVLAASAKSTTNHAPTNWQLKHAKAKLV